MVSRGMVAQISERLEELRRLRGDEASAKRLFGGVSVGRLKVYEQAAGGGWGRRCWSWGAGGGGDGGRFVVRSGLLVV